MFCLPGIWENVKFIFFFALPAKIYHQIYITIKQHTYVDFFPHIPYTPFFHLSFFIFPDSRFCKYIVLQALIPLIFIFPAHSQIFHRHILLCFNLLRIFPDFRSFLFRRWYRKRIYFFYRHNILVLQRFQRSALSFCENFSWQKTRIGYLVHI